MLVHRTKKLLVRSTCVGSDNHISIANRADPDMGLLFFAKALKGIYEEQG